MPKFGKTSLARRATLHPDLQGIVDEAIQVVDFFIATGHRSEAEQNAAFDKKVSQKRWPESKHNKTPSEAMDVVPWPTQWACEKQIYLLAGVIKAIAHSRGVKIRWGGDWDSDGDLTDQRFNDPCHFELVK